MTPDDVNVRDAAFAGSGSGAVLDAGSATVEAAGLMIPVLGTCILMLVFGLHLAAAGQALTAAAAAAARAASLQPTSSTALAAARAETQASLSGLGPRSRRCTQLQVDLDAGAFQPGGTVVVTLTCTLPVAALTGAGLPGHLTRTVTSRAPIDRYTAFDE